MATALSCARNHLGLADHPLRPAEPAPWIAPMLALGFRTSRYADAHAGQQLIVAISVPCRDFAAVLIGCGWVVARPAQPLRPPIEVLRETAPGALVRVVTEHKVIVDHFVALNESTTPPRLCLANSSQWQLTHVRGVRVLDGSQEPISTTRPHPGPIGRMAHLQGTWDSRLAAPAADLAIVGTLTWLREELGAFLCREGEDPDRPKKLTDDLAKAATRRRPFKIGMGHGSLADVILPKDAKTPTWFTRLYSSSRLEGQLPLPKDLTAVVLDGNGAIKHLAEIETPVVICVLDRSVADEAAAELIVQLRNTRGELVSVREDLGWTPPAGVEVLAFTVAL